VCSGTERISSGEMVQLAVVLSGFRLVVCYTVSIVVVWYVTL